MTNAVAEKPATAVALTFGTIPASEMAKPKQYKQVSKAMQAERDQFDSFVKNIPAGRVGTVAITESLSARGIMGRIRGALKRTGLTGNMVHNQDKGQVELELKSKVATLATAQ